MGVPLLDNPVVTVPTAIAALLVAAAIIWRKGVLPMFHFFQNVGRIAEATPVLVQIAEEFRPNGGGSLRDVVERIEAKVDDAASLAHETKVDIGGKLDAHLRLPAWHNERDAVLERLARLEEQTRG